MWSFAARTIVVIAGSTAIVVLHKFLPDWRGIIIGVTAAFAVGGMYDGVTRLMDGEARDG